MRDDALYFFEVLGFSLAYRRFRPWCSGELTSSLPVRLLMFQMSRGNAVSADSRLYTRTNSDNAIGLSRNEITGHLICLRFTRSSPNIKSLLLRLEGSPLPWYDV